MSYSMLNLQVVQEAQEDQVAQEVPEDQLVPLVQAVKATPDITQVCIN